MATYKVDPLLAFVQQNFMQDQAQKSLGGSQDQMKRALLDVLAQLGGLTVTDNDIVFEGSKIVLPSVYDGRVPDAINYLTNYVEAQEKHYEYSRTFNYRPWDGAHAFQAALMKVFGTTGLGKDIVSFFGSSPPEMRTIANGFNNTTQIPWGKVELPQLEAKFYLDGENSMEFGVLFKLHVEAPKKYRKHIEAFFQVLEEELKNNSIYRGKAINGASDPAFLDVDRVDRSKVIYSEEVQTQLEANLWSLLRYSDTMRDSGIPLKRAVLVEGPYGTGKTLAGMLTAKLAQEKGWTFILCRPGQDDLLQVLKTAQLYAPAVVWYEDIDTVASGGSDMDISRMLDALDGATAKGVEVIAGFTTNHVDKIQKAVMRPGRLDAVIHIGELDLAGFKQLIINLVPAANLGDIDYTHVAKAMTGFLPAFATEAVNRAMRYSIARNNGKLSKITSDDLVNAAIGLRPQLDLMNGAKEGSDDVTIDDLVSDLVANVVDRTHLAKTDDGECKLEVNED